MIMTMIIVVSVNSKNLVNHTGTKNRKKFKNLKERQGLREESINPNAVFAKLASRRLSQTNDPKFTG
jgi:hypothetical protein